MFNKLDKMKKAYMDRKYSMIKGVEYNDSNMKVLSKQEEEMIQKLQTTFSKVNEFTDQSNTFDTVTQSIISNINHSRKHLKPISKLDDCRDSNAGNQLPLTPFDSHQQTGNKS